MSAPALPPYFVAQQHFPPGNDSSSSSSSVVFWPENPIDNAQSRMLDFPPFKRPRIAGDNHSITVPIVDNNPRILENNPPHINNPNPPRMPPPPTKGNHIFFKTRPCPRFREGTCPYGSNCNFAHGIEDIRKPPSNWQEIAGLHGDSRVVKWEDDLEIINRHRLCRNYVNGRVCNYGERCNYRHEDPAKFREEARFGVTAALSDNGARSEHSDAINTVNPNFDVNRVNTKFEQPWKTKMCNKWLAGSCTYGDKCHFAHGPEELKRFGAHNDAMMVNATPAPKPLPTPTTNDASVVKAVVPGASSKNQVLNKFLLKWKGPEKISRIYADWIDDINPVEN
ncbi:hypothetical protein ACHQM5_020393 [Ranunculus cassubicifolius]